MSKRILFVSQRNSLRSVLAQACLMHIGGHLFVAESCGQPGHVSRAPHPAAIAALKSARIAVPASPPRPWTDISRMSSPKLDFVVTLDERTLASQPAWPGQPICALWSFEDAAALDDAQLATQVAVRTLFALQRRLELLVNLALHEADSAAIQSDLRDLGHMA
ncbi:protein tyrosine phosphatase [Variovorax sp. J22R133]|uniref:arsenate-mycothiol transferase ArsC n=1 Tax=Variovorax brevis TaxID=3053503 RepID=UPI0025757A10|nr:protein tyrosine phosphatase [Variovorax sp. J22R133]MDM0111972.1 protein tyrosine phosphatase [Variovorax sp. J22R133]